MADEEREKKMAQEEIESEENYSPEAEQKRQVYLLLGLGALLIGIVVFQIGRMQAIQQEADMVDGLVSMERLVWIEPDTPDVLTGFMIFDPRQQLLIAHPKDRPNQEYVVWVNHSLPPPNELMVFSFLNAQDIRMGTDMVRILNPYSGYMRWQHGEEERMVIPDGLGGYFDVTHSALNQMAILRFAPFRDFAGTILDPIRISAEQASQEKVYSSTGEVSYLNPQDRILGVVSESFACAYPVKVMEKHYILEDSTEDSRFSLVYDNLSSAGVAFLAGDEGSFLDLSGLFHEGTAVLYDRATKSLWSFLRQEGLTGPRRGDFLAVKPVIQTTWEEWQRLYPDAYVLSPFLVDGSTQQIHLYGQEIFRGGIPLGSERRIGYYYEEESLIQPVVVEDETTGLRTIWGRVNDTLPNKVWVLGIRGREGQMAYPIPELARAADRTLSVQFEGRTLELRFDPESETAYALDEGGKPLPEATLCLWFAWVTAYPETGIFRADSLEE